MLLKSSIINSCIRFRLKSRFNPLNNPPYYFLTGWGLEAKTRLSPRFISTSNNEDGKREKVMINIYFL